MVQIQSRGRRRRGVGASIQPRYRSGVGRPAMAVAEIEQQVAHYGPTEYDAEGYGPMGLGLTTIPAGSVGMQVTVRPRRPIQIEEWRFPSTVIGLQVDEISIGGTPTFANPGVPIELYSEVSRIAQPEDQPTVTPDTGCTFTVSNPTGGDLVFSGAGWGQVLRRG